MKTITILLTAILFSSISSYAQTKVDTLYYNQDWKGVENSAFATYYRVVVDSGDSGFVSKCYDFYITGERQGESGYVTIDKYDDSNSVFDGDWTTYYKSGNVETKGSRVSGVLEGEYYKYAENGLILEHSYYKNGQLDGIHTEFVDGSDLCIQVEYENGVIVEDYYVVSNSTGSRSKFRLSDDTPIYETPSLEDKKIEYKDDDTWYYYGLNGFLVSVNCYAVRDYGKFYRIETTISNFSMIPIDFGVQNVTVTLTDEKGVDSQLKVFTSAEYSKKVKSVQSADAFFNAFNRSMAASNAGKSSSATTATASGTSSAQANASVSGSGGSAYGTASGSSNSSGYYSSYTTSYDGAAAYQASVIAEEQIKSFNDNLLAERNMREEGYLKRTTIYPGEAISGYINVECKKGKSLLIEFDVNGVIYQFPIEISESDLEKPRIVHRIM